MRYYRFDSGGEPRLLGRDGDELIDLTSANPDLRSLSQLLSAAEASGQSLDEAAEQLIGRADPIEIDQLDHDAALPVVPDEVWAAGVTYEISEQAREDESRLPEVYRDVYHSDRPELFFKATSSRTVGPGESIGVRKDSDWNVPEPELAVILYDGSIVGYTIGNDVSSRAIEGENPLYLPQAKIYERCCSIGPCFVPESMIDDPHDLEISMEIRRENEVVFDGFTSTAQMVRRCDELVSYLKRSNVIPTITVLLTGTSLVPPDAVSLKPDDVVEIQIESIGTLQNPVISV